MKKAVLLQFNVDKVARQIKVQRSFDAPLIHVWAAWTQPELLDKWWAPLPWVARTKEMDFREGGCWHYAMVAPDHTEHWVKMEFLHISASEFFSARENFCNPNGTLNRQLPSSKWEIRFSELPGGATILDIAISFHSLSDLQTITAMGFEEGFTDAMRQLDNQLTGNSNAAEVRVVIGNWCQAIRDADYQKILSAHTPDILMFDVPPPLQSKGLDAYKKTWDLFFRYSAGGEGSFELEELQITAGEDVAFCTALVVIGKGRNPECHLTVGLVKKDGQWLIAHEHHSAPSPIS